jgi:hypothetical protein
MKQINKRAQEEMVGFALIIILVAVILLVFLGFSLRDQEKEAVESYEVESFIQSFLHYTSDCRDNLEFLPVQKLISSCSNNQRCLDGRLACDVLEQTLKGIVEESWKTGAERPVKSYELKINSFEEEILELKEGNITANSKGSVQFLPNSIEIFFTAYF